MRIAQKVREIIRQVVHNTNAIKNRAKLIVASIINRAKNRLNKYEILGKLLTNIASFTRSFCGFCVERVREIYADYIAPLFSIVFGIIEILCLCLHKFVIKKFTKHIWQKLLFHLTTSNFAQKIYCKSSAFAKKSYFAIKTKVTSFYLNQKLHIAKNPLKAFIYAVCAILVLFGAFGIGFRYGAKYGIIALLDSSNAQREATFFSAFIESSLANSNVVLLPKDYVENLTKQTLESNKAQMTNTPPIMPQANQSQHIFYGNYTFSTALALAKQALLERDFILARIWIYKAWEMHTGNAQVWELYLQSYEEDTSTSGKAKNEARELFEQARAYYGF